VINFNQINITEGSQTLETTQNVLDCSSSPRTKRNLKRAALELWGRSCVYCHVYEWLQTGFGLVIGFINQSQVATTTKYNTLADSHITNHSTLNFLRVLSLVFAIRFLAMDLSQSHLNFKHHCNYKICKVFDSYTKSSWHSLIPLIAASLNPDLRPHYDSLSLSLSSDSVLDNSPFDTFYLLLTGHSTGTILNSKRTLSYC
jgi:hypothetical protein